MRWKLEKGVKDEKEREHKRGDKTNTKTKKKKII
jgi:hypothetical protein